jgi:transcriptional regulator with XRE-family HTH domain
VDSVSSHLAAGDLKAARIALGLRQSDVARRALCSLASVRIFESGYRPRGASPVLVRIEAALADADCGREA